MNKFAIGLEKFYRFMLLLFGGFAVAVIWAMSIFFNCYMASDANENTYFCKDHGILNIVLIVGFIAVLFFLKKKSVYTIFKVKLEDDDFFKKTKKVILWTITIMGFLWVVITQYVPGSDQLDVLASAYKYGVGDVSMAQPGGYLDQWPHNIGTATVERLLGFIAGDFNITFMQLLNVLGITLLYKKVADSWDKMGGSRLAQVCTLACGVIFYPLIMYASFVYGNIWSMTFSAIALDEELKYFQTKKNRCIVGAALALGLSFMIKSSALIYVVALCILPFVKGIMDGEKLYKIVVTMVAMVLTVAVFSNVPKMTLQKVTGVTLRESDGIWALVAMGLQEEGITAGWYNGYPMNVYYENNCDTVASEKAAKEEAFNRIKFLLSDKHNAYEFFSKKTASTWIEPTYQGYWINQVRTHRVIFPKWLDSFMSVDGYNVAVEVFNIFQILIFTGTLLWMILEDKTTITAKSFMLLCFIGEFVFLHFWETKSQYTITFFILLFPYAMQGFELLVDREYEKLTSVFGVCNKVVLVYCSAIAVLFLVGYVMDASHCLSNQNAEYELYSQTWQTQAGAESVLEINITKAQLKAEQEKNAYLMKVLNENGIAY